MTLAKRANNLKLNHQAYQTYQNMSQPITVEIFCIDRFRAPRRRNIKKAESPELFI